jgi:hypothetical protein
MFKRVLTLATSSAALMVGLAAPSFAAPADYVGTWVNKNPNTRSVTRFVVKKISADKLSVQVFGKCHPTDCDWGNSRFITYGTSVQDTSGAYGTAAYDQGFSRSLLTFNRAGQEVMLQGFTQFVDNSGRQNYYIREYFTRTP